MGGAAHFSATPCIVFLSFKSLSLLILVIVFTIGPILQFLLLLDCPCTF